MIDTNLTDVGNISLVCMYIVLKDIEIANFPKMAIGAIPIKHTNNT